GRVPARAAWGGSRHAAGSPGAGANRPGADHTATAALGPQPDAARPRRASRTPATGRRRATAAPTGAREPGRVAAPAATDHRTGRSEDAPLAAGRPQPANAALRSRPGRPAAAAGAKARGDRPIG